MSRHTRTLDDHLFGPGPKRILALDGGGVLGVIEIAFVEKIEAMLRERFGDDELVLADYFDLIGGTSTGAIIATALALGMSASEVKALYFDMAPAIFKRPLFSIPGVHPKFHARALANKLRGILKDRKLGSDDLKTGLALVAKRVDTGSPWVLTNNSRSRLWEDPPLDPKTGKPEYIGNKKYLLRNLLRASTAAPFFFNPKKIAISDGVDGLFVDGGISPHNNPALQLLMLAGVEGYGFKWPVSDDQLMMISLGSGWARPKIGTSRGSRIAPALFAVETLRGLVWDGQVNTLMVLQWLSDPRRPWPINSEVNTLQNDFLGGAAGSRGMLKFQRYDIAFDADWIKSELGVSMEKPEVEGLNDFTEPDVMQPTYELACKAAQLHVDGADFPAQFDLSASSSV